MRNNSFLTWLGQLLLGFTLFTSSLKVGLIFGFGFWYVSVPCALTALIGLAIAMRAELKERPLRTLRKAESNLVLPTQWSVKFGKTLPDGSRVDIAIIRSDGVRFVVDIREETLVYWGTPVDGSGKPPLVGPRGKPLQPDPIGPLTKAALTASAAPVLWLPMAESAANLRHPDSNLIIVMGTARDLKHALQSAEIVPDRASEHVVPTTAKSKANAETLPAGKARQHATA